jgi:hypothetical protein
MYPTVRQVDFERLEPPRNRRLRALRGAVESFGGVGEPGKKRGWKILELSGGFI